jgi:hypothetical protein
MIYVRLYSNGQEGARGAAQVRSHRYSSSAGGSSPRLFAQERVEAGIFLDYLSISQTNTNNFAVGGRFGYRIHRKVMMEGELAQTWVEFWCCTRWPTYLGQGLLGPTPF